MIDSDFVNRVFAPDGGAKQLHLRLGAKPHAVRDSFVDALWPSVA